jgi:hypothetical protein
MRRVGGSGAVHAGRAPGVFAVLRLMTRPISTGPPPPASTNASPGTGRRPRSPATRRRPQRNEGAEAPLTTAGCPQLAKADAASAACPSVNPPKPAWIGPTLFWRPPSVPGSGSFRSPEPLRVSALRGHDPMTRVTPKLFNSLGFPAASYQRTGTANPKLSHWCRKRDSNPRPHHYE